MRFLVSRGSARFFDKGLKPLPAARWQRYVHRDERGVDDPAKVPAYRGETDWWYGDGRNHRVEGGHIVRDRDDWGWFLKVETMEELLVLLREHSSLWVEASFLGGGVPGIGLAHECE